MPLGTRRFFGGHIVHRHAEAHQRVLQTPLAQADGSLQAFGNHQAEGAADLEMRAACPLQERARLFIAIQACIEEGQRIGQQAVRKPVVRIQARVALDGDGEPLLVVGHHHEHRPHCQQMGLHLVIAVHTAICLQRVEPGKHRQGLLVAMRECERPEVGHTQPRVGVQHRGGQLVEPSRQQAEAADVQQLLHMVPQHAG
ncbi:hypothetical protein D9M69_412680 [compost metagenome]